jgi:hypothetical protein
MAESVNHRSSTWLAGFRGYQVTRKCYVTENSDNAPDEERVLLNAEKGFAI